MRLSRGIAEIFFAGGRLFVAGSTLPPLYPAGGVLSLSPADFAFSLIFCPHPPAPLPPRGRGVQSLFRRGLRPRHPCTEPLAALTEPAIQVPCEREPAARCKNDGNTFLWTMPAAKERGDRGRGTSAFEMVLSPGAGKQAKGGAGRRQRRHAPPPGKAAANPAADQQGTPPAGYSGGKPSRRPKQSSPPAREAAFNRDSGLITFSASGQQHRRTARPARRRRTAPAPSRNRTICSPPQSFPQLHR